MIPGPARSRRRGLLAISITALCALGCAQSRLYVTVAIYDEDPSVLTFMDDSTAQALLGAAEGMRAPACEIALRRIWIANQMYAVYENLTIMNGEGEARAKRFDVRRRLYVERLAEAAARVDARIDRAIDRIESYRATRAEIYPKLAGIDPPRVGDHLSRGASEPGARPERRSAGVPCRLELADGRPESPSRRRERFLEDSFQDGELEPTEGIEAERVEPETDGDPQEPERTEAAAEIVRSDVDPALARELRLAEDLAKGAAQAVVEAFANLSIAAKADYGLRRKWSGVERALDPANVPRLRRLVKQLTAEARGKQKPPVTVEQFDRAALDAQRLINELAEELRVIAETPEELGDEVRIKLETALVRTATLADSQRAVINASNSLMAAPPISSQTRDAITHLVQNSEFALSQIDRLQDSGDPVWRIVTRPENEGRWNTTFSRTYFYAEGKSEVVVVRDNPMTFRIQRGTNDPTNLIRGQLQIARSVTDAAISIASAASGLPVGGLTSFQPSGDDSEGEGTIAPGDPELQKRAKTFAEQRASAEAEARFRRAALRSLDVNLRNVQQRLLESAAGSPEESAALDQLRSVLLGSKPKFPDS